MFKYAYEFGPVECFGYVYVEFAVVADDLFGKVAEARFGLRIFLSVAFVAAYVRASIEEHKHGQH